MEMLSEQTRHSTSIRKTPEIVSFLFFSFLKHLLRREDVPEKRPHQTQTSLQPIRCLETLAWKRGGKQGTL